jgi:hypothetical protein
VRTDTLVVDEGIQNKVIFLIKPVPLGCRILSLDKAMKNPFYDLDVLLDSRIDLATVSIHLCRYLLPRIPNQG